MFNLRNKIGYPLESEIMDLLPSWIWVRVWDFAVPHRIVSTSNFIKRINILSRINGPRDEPPKES